ncbi:MAG: hypothetical protein GF330_00595 [Candidatus Eisenbacteria bacterium]|nr:hypothetical protein [Candidatus Eisenbacteria bacterium]
MDREGFRTFLRSWQVSDEAAHASLRAIERFERFLEQSRATRRARTSDAGGEEEDAAPLTRAGSSELDAYLATLIAQRANRREDLTAITRYARFTANDPLYVAAFELLDGSQALDNLYRRLGRELGPEGRGRVFGDIPPPPLGTPNSQKPPLTQAIIERLIGTVGPLRCAAILEEGLHESPAPPRRDAGRRVHFSLSSLDAHLEEQRAARLAELEEAQTHGRLWFTQPVTPEVIAFVRSEPEIASPVRRGHTLYKTKIPYMTHDYLQATEAHERNYSYCHCPWVRDALRSGAAQVPPIWCNCSTACIKRPYETLLGQPLAAEILESVLRGDARCRFAIHLPPQVT